MSLKLLINVGKESHTFELPSNDVLVEELQRLIEDKTGILTRKQKLIFKGKTLVSSNTLLQHGLKDGSKILLVATDGVQRQVAAPQKVDPSKTLSALLQKRSEPVKSFSPASFQVRAANWSKTGIVGAQGEGLTAVPAEVCQLGAAARTVDMSRNQIAVLPPGISQLVALSSLKLSSNLLTWDSIPWPGFSALSGLTQLMLDNNKITQVPDSISALTQLRHLSLQGNGLESLPEAVSCLQRLEQVEVDQNRLTSLPQGLGCCTALIVINASDNLIASLPDSVSKLQNLRSFKMQNNRLRALPSTMLSACSSLITLQLQNNPITLAQLRETPGFEDYDARRKAKIDKQLDLDVLTDDASFHQGADEQQWERFSAFNKPK